MDKHTTIPAKPGIPPTRIDGVDVDRLLRDIGEASASTSAVDLFGLCLVAQRVLARVTAGPGSAPDEGELVAAFRAMDDSARSDMLSVMESVATANPRRPPVALAMVPNRQRHRGFVDLFVLMMLGMIGWIGYLALRPEPQAPAPLPAPTSNAGIAYAPYVFLDTLTGCQYLSTHTSTGLVPRVAADGKTHMGCTGGAR
jgi:hypothetical protein